MAIYRVPLPRRLDSDPATKTAVRRDLLALTRLFLREETTPDDLAAAIGFVLIKRESYLVAPKDTLFRIASIAIEAGPTGERPEKLYLNIAAESGLTIDHLPREFGNYRSLYPISDEVEYEYEDAALPFGATIQVSLKEQSITRIYIDRSARP